MGAFVGNLEAKHKLRTPRVQSIEELPILNKLMRLGPFLSLGVGCYPRGMWSEDGPRWLVDNVGKKHEKIVNSGLAGILPLRLPC